MGNLFATYLMPFATYLQPICCFCSLFAAICNLCAIYEKSVRHPLGKPLQNSKEIYFSEPGDVESELQGQKSTSEEKAASGGDENLNKAFWKRKMRNSWGPKVPLAFVSSSPSASARPQRAGARLTMRAESTVASMNSAMPAASWATMRICGHRGGSWMQSAMAPSPA